MLCCDWGVAHTAILAILCSIWGGFAIVDDDPIQCIFHARALKPIYVCVRIRFNVLFVTWKLRASISKWECEKITSSKTHAHTESDITFATP